MMMSMTFVRNRFTRKLFATKIKQR